MTGRRALLAVALVLSGCGLVGGGTTLKIESVGTEAFRFDDLEAGGPRYFRLSGVDVCTDGGDAVKVTGVRLVGSNAPEVVAFRVSRSAYADGGSGSGGQLSTSPVSQKSGPSGAFSHACGDEGRVSLTIDTRFDELPVETQRIAVSYRAGGEAKVADLKVPVVLCGPTVGCPGGADE